MNAVDQAAGSETKQDSGPASLSSAAKAVVDPAQTPCQRASALNQQHLPVDAVRSMAHDLPERKSVWWAAQSARKVSNPAHTADLRAIQAAEAWAKNPSARAQQLAAEAAAKSKFQTPGPWAAQAAAWAGGGLTPQAVSGAVLLAAVQAGKPIAVPQVTAPKLSAPDLALKMAKPQLPSIKLPSVAKPELTPVKIPIKAPDGLTLTAPEREDLVKNVDPYLKLGCDVSTGKNSWA